MKKITKLFALVLALALVLSLTACASKGIAGSWSYTIDMKKAMESSGEMEDLTDSEDAESAKAMAEMFAKIFDGVNMIVVLDLKEDNTFTLHMDEASAKTAAETMKTKMTEMMPELLASMFGGQEGLNDYLEENNLTMEDMTASMGQMFDTDEMVNQLSDSATPSGTYRYEEGKLTLTTEEDGETSEAVLTVNLDGDTLNVTEINGESDLDGFKSLLPITFNR